MEGTSKSFCNEKQEIMESGNKEKNINVVELITNSVADWRTFGRILGLRESYLEQLQANYQFHYQRNFEIIKQFSYPFEPKQSWTFWREYLQQFRNGEIVVKDIEMDHMEFLAEASYNVEHIVSMKDNIYIGHPYEYNSTELLSESDIKNAIISVRLSDEKHGFTDYQEYQDWVLTQKHYIDTYKMLKDKKIINFIDEYCPILETLNAYFTKTNDTGFAVKGYNFVNEFCLFKKGVFPKHIFSDTYFSYFANENIVLYITKCTKGTSHAFYHSMQNIRIANTIHKELREQNITQVNVIVHNNNSAAVFCKQCIDNDLFVKEDIFTDIEKFSSWYSKVLEKRTKIRSKIEQPEKENQLAAAENNKNTTPWYTKILKRIRRNITKTKGPDIMNKIKTKEEICESIKKHIITYEALERNVLPSFSNLPEDQIEELKKLIVLSPNQFKALHSNHKHILLRGSYGSGKSLVLLKKFEQVIYNMSELDIVYLICNDQQSELTHYLITHYIKYVLPKYSMKKVIVCNSKQFNLDRKKVVPRLSYILSNIEHIWKFRTVHILIDEFDGSYFNESEIKILKSILVKFQNSHIFVALQSMEKIIEKTDNDVGYKFNLLTKTTSFMCYNLDYSLRSSCEINEFIKATAKVIETSKVLFDEVLGFVAFNTVVDSEQGLEDCCLYERPVIGTYKYNQNEEIGHTVSSGKVNIYHLSWKEVDDKFGCRSIKLIVYLSTLVHTLKELSEFQKYVICTYDYLLYNTVYFHLQKSFFNNWTDKIKEFINPKSTFTVLLTDYASVRGYEFSNFIFLSPFGTRKFRYRMLECFARSTTKLHIISDEIDITEESIEHQIIDKWKKLQCVNFYYCSYDKSADKVYISHGGDVIYCKENASQLQAKDFRIMANYPWVKKSEKIIELESKRQHDDISIGMRCVVSMDNIRLFDDFIKLHDVDVYSCRYFDDDQNLLHLAIKHEAVVILKSLINDYKVDVNSTDKHKKTPLHLAALFEFSNFTDILIKNGADVNVKDNLDNTPLHISSDKGFVNIVQILLENGADINVKNEIGNTPLHNSLSRGHINIVQLLLDNEADVNVKNGYDDTPLHISSRTGHINIVQLLLDNEADVNVKNGYDDTPLHISSRTGRITIVKLLLQNGSAINLKNKNSETPLHESLSTVHINIVQLLLDNGADVNVKDRYGRTPLHTSLCENRHINIIQLLLKNGADVNVKDKNGDTPLHVSSYPKYTNIDQLLLDNGADVNVKNENGDTPLYKSSDSDHFSSVRLLLKNGADVNVKNENGDTPLHISSRKGHISIVKLLLKNGADVNVKNVLGETSIYFADTRRHYDIVALLKRYLKSN